MHDLEEYNYTPGQAIEAASMRICAICHDEITSAELKKGGASWLPAGANLRFSVHNSCLADIEQAIEEQREQEQEAQRAAQFVRDLARTAQQAMRKDR